ncbi:myelin-oligodendrocyte glycoprotein-like isoform X2 [Chelmon rostratus]|uniref:myelin-oligodendrocyte glycoprotein-like isoform X2 n=1 Tax=Chelmon rostratus TaxID=109905 RepID=UPI001BE7B0F2|nr:myelin-oligodendrocyte glycoprotein-like isoform X2 [Chelmon rostratus]
MVHVGDFVLGFSFPLWPFIAHLSTVAWTTDEGQPQVIGSPQPIITTLGDDVILPCHLKPTLDMEGKTVEWSKPDLKPDPSDRLSRVEYVHLYRDWQDIPDMQLRSYAGRTKMFPDRLKHGNISLKIMSVMLTDAGRYKCHVPKLINAVKESIVELVVEPNSVQTWTPGTTLHPRNVQTPDPRNEINVTGGRSHLATVIAAVLCTLLILGVVVAYLLHRKCQQQNLIKYDDTPCKPLPA